MSNLRWWLIRKIPGFESMIYFFTHLETNHSLWPISVQSPVASPDWGNMLGIILDLSLTALLTIPISYLLRSYLRAKVSHREWSFEESTPVESSISLSGSVGQFQLQRWIKLIRHKQMIHLTEASSHERDSSSKNNSELRVVEADYFPVPRN